MNIVRNIEKFVKKNKTQILSSIGTISIIATGIIASMDTKRYLQNKGHELAVKGRELTKSETAVVVAKSYARTAAVATAGVSCNVAAQAMTIQQLAGLGVGIGYLKNRVDSKDELLNTVKTCIGEEKYDKAVKVLSDTKAELMGELPPANENFDEPMVLIVDDYHEKPYYAKRSDIFKALNEANNLLHEYGISWMADFWESAGAPAGDGADILGFDEQIQGELYGSKPIDIRLTDEVSEKTKKPYVKLDFITEPYIVEAALWDEEFLERIK